MIRRVRYIAEAALFGVLAGVARRSSPAARFRVGTIVGDLWWIIDARHRRVALSNLRLAYRGTLSAEATREIARGSMRHMARVAIETLALDQFLDGPLEQHLAVEGVEHLRAAVAKGGGVIGVTAHLGYWELFGLAFARLGVPTVAIARPLDNPYLEKRLMRLRTIAGTGIIDKRSAFRPALRELRQGHLVGILIDQRPKRDGIVVPFFGADAYTTEGVAMLAAASDAAIIPAFVVREPAGTLRLVFEPEVPVVRTGDAEANAHRLTAECTSIVERWVRLYPDQWLWTHRRWGLPQDRRDAISASDGRAGRP